MAALSFPFWQGYEDQNPMGDSAESYKVTQLIVGSASAVAWVERVPSDRVELSDS